ncbi:MAG TPA: Crp/Fnr family transcriptional regulator [Allosphingosinicella sp.]|nr:Crp/Fnr family transcriptional regulator [Allosphingosinicella sp.]
MSHSSEPIPDATLEPMIRKLMGWRKLDEDDQAALRALPHRIITLRPQEYIVREGDKPQHCCLMLSGFAFRHKVAGNGGRQIFSIHMKGDLADLQNSLLGVADHNLQTLTHVRVALIPVDAIQDIAFFRPAVGRAMWYETLVDASIFREWTLNVGRRDARTRTAHMLCEFSLRLVTAGLGDRCNYELPMTQEQLADALGLTSVHVNRTLMALGSEGLISRAQRAVRIEDWPRLAKEGDFDPAYLHFQGDRDAAPAEA